MKVRIDPILFNEIRISQGLTYSDIEEITSGELQVHGLKYLVNGRNRLLSEEKASTLASALGCRLEDILASDFLRWASVPSEVQLIVRRLFLESRADIQPTYFRMLEQRWKSVGFRKLLSQAAKLGEILTRPALEEQPQVKTLLALECIQTRFAPDGDLFTSELGLGLQEHEHFLNRIANLTVEFNAQHCLLLLTYSVILFESLFLELNVASAAQLSLERWRDTVEQYYLVTHRAELLRVRIVDYVLNDYQRFTSASQWELEITENLFNDTLLVVLAAAEGGRHIDSDFFASQYVNRKVFQGIVTRLYRTAEEILDLNIPAENPLGPYLTRFGQQYQKLRLMKRMVNENPLILGAMGSLWIR